MAMISSGIKELNLINMKPELKVFNNLIETMLVCSSNNEAHITDVRVWTDAWKKEMNLAINYSQCCVTNSEDKDKTKNNKEQRKEAFNTEVEQLVCPKCKSDNVSTKTLGSFNSCRVCYNYWAK